MQTTLLIVAAVGFVAAFVLRSAKPDKPPLAWTAFGIALALGLAAFVVPNLADDSPDASDVKLTILTPEDGDTVVAGAPIDVEVEIEGAELATSLGDQGGHIHVYVDGTVEQMPIGPRTTITLKPGEREVSVEYVDADHVPFDPPIQESVTVTAERR